jgi:hypothetical protein
MEEGLKVDEDKRAELSQRWQTLVKINGRKRLGCRQRKWTRMV